jgi:hypothetical protein
MTKSHEKIVTDSIQKANANGFSVKILKVNYSKHPTRLENICNVLVDDDFFSDRVTSVEHIIFSHDFAKAFWRDDWKYHLQKMVLSEDPIHYLSKFIVEYRLGYHAVVP